MSKKDNSPKVHQREKIKFELNIRERHDYTEKQKEIIKCGLDNKTKCIILDGVPGTSKTHLSVLTALKLLNEKKISDIVYIRSLIQSKDGETGFLSGDLQEKTYYYNYPLFQQLDELLPKNQTELINKDERIKTYPTSMLRGYNFHNSVIIFDEAQNAVWDSLLTVLERAGQFSKIFLIGDNIFQNDLGKKSGFSKLISIFSDKESEENGIRYFNLGSDDIVRSPFVKFIIEKVQKSQKDQKIQDWSPGK